MPPNRSGSKAIAQDASPIVNICACGSSGSTLLAQTIDRHPQVACGDELFFFCSPQLYDQFPLVQKWHLPVRLMGLSGNPYHQGRALFRHTKAYGLSRAKLWRWMVESEDITSLARRMQRHVTQRTGKSIWAEKTPRNIRVISKFIKTFPDAKIIHIVRDPRDVIASLMKRKKSLLNAAEAWLGSVAAIGPHRHSSQLLELRYEDLCFDADKVMQKVCDFLNIEFDTRYFSSDVHISAQLGKFSGHESWAVRPTDAFSTQSIGRHKNISLEWDLVSEIRLTPQYANLLGTQQWTLGGLAKCYGYDMNINPSNLNHVDYAVFKSGWHLSAVRQGFDSLLGIPPYINMIEFPNSLKE